MTKKNTPLVLLAIVFASSLLLTACNEQTTTKAETSEASSETPETSAHSSESADAQTADTSSDTKTKTGETTAVFTNEMKNKTTLTFKNNKLIKETSEQILPYKRSSSPMSKEEFETLERSNKAELEGEKGITYEYSFPEDGASKRSFTIDFTTVSIEKVQWLTSMTADITLEDATTTMEELGYKKTN